MPRIADTCDVCPVDANGDCSDSVAYFKISRFVENEKEEMVDCLKSVYHVLANSGSGVALVIHRKQNGCEIGLAVGNSSGNSERTIKDAQRLKDSFLGNFPGSSCEGILSDIGNASSLFAQINEKYTEKKNSSIAIVSNIATEFADGYSTQGIEKLLDGIRPMDDDSEYTIIILGEALRDSDLKAAKEKLYENYSLLSPYASEQKSISLSYAKQSGWNWNLILAGHNWGTTTGLDSGTSSEVINYKVKHTLDVIEKQMDRLEESAALGLWKFAAYVTSADLATTKEVAHMYMSLTQGRDSFAEQPAINVWNGQDEVNVKKIQMMTQSLRYLKHPVFSNDLTATTIVSGAEFARSLSLPQKSVSGFPVFSCARFGRNVSTYAERKGDLFELGKIYHMRQTDNTVVSLDKKSLASHVFITGSTGAGKSNTVFQMLKGANTPFLVVEPAKGEYKNVFGGYEDVSVLGTNPKVTDLLRINPFSFPEYISVSEHIDRLVELFNVCWPMYAAMPAILKDAVIKAYETAGWDIGLSENKYSNDLFPAFIDVLDQIRIVLNSSDYSAENKSDYTGALVTRLRSLTNGINGQIFTTNGISDEDLFDKKVIVDLSRVGSTETRSLIMGLLVMKLQEYRLSSSRPNNSNLCHITVLEEAHNILKKTSAEQSAESSNLAGKSVEMLTNAIAELRAFGEGFIIADQAPGLLDMAIIRNTNTKIIHRLPDQSDRELAGRAAGLNEEQIREIAKLELGVAAIYQNDWIEPVLCKVSEFSESDKVPYTLSENERYIFDNQKAKQMVRDVLLKPYEFIKIDVNLVKSSNLPAQVKIMVLEMNKGQTVREDRKAKMFYMLYPTIPITFRKDLDGKYLKNIQAEIVESCGEMSISEATIATAYILGVSSGVGKVNSEDYEVIREELRAYGSIHRRSD